MSYARAVYTRPQRRPVQPAVSTPTVNQPQTHGPLQNITVQPSVQALDAQSVPLGGLPALDTLDIDEADDLTEESPYYRVYTVRQSVILPVFKLCHSVAEKSLTGLPRGSAEYVTRLELTNNLGVTIRRIQSRVLGKDPRPALLVKPNPTLVYPSESDARRAHILPITSFGSNRTTAPASLAFFCVPLRTRKNPNAIITTKPMWLPKFDSLGHAWMIVVPLQTVDGAIPERSALWEKGHNHITFSMTSVNRKHTNRACYVAIKNFAKNCAYGAYVEDRNGKKLLKGTEYLLHVVNSLDESFKSDEHAVV